MFYNFFFFLPKIVQFMM